MIAPVYFDHNASTPIDPLVIERMVSAMQRHAANPASVDHAWGNAAHQAIEGARTAIAEQLGARASDLVFTGGATEANNIAIRGAYRAGVQAGRRRIVTAASEHPSVLATATDLAHEGAEVVVLPVDGQGRLDLEELRASLTPDTALVSLMGANNETGVIHPVGEIAIICADAEVPYHSDLTQLAVHLSVDLASLGVTLATFSGHKLYGPKGIGVLFARSRRPRAHIVPPLTGGGQERGLRPGTLSTEAVLGLEAAFERRHAALASTPELAEKRDALERRLARIPGLEINGCEAPRLPNTINVSVAGVDPHALQHRLRDRLIFSTSSACTTQKVQASRVLTAMFGEGPRARSGFRLGLGRGTTSDDVEQAGELIAAAVELLREGRVGPVELPRVTA